MAWLTSLFKKPETIDDECTPAENGAQPPPVASGPPLAILAPDIAGISAFRLRFFPDASTAAAEIEQLPPEMRRGTHAFWALHDEPVLPPDGHREALVLIRANLTSGVVYAVSFTDMESAWSFARFEAKRGLDISHLVILWAAFATVCEELDGVSVLPAAAPETKAQQVRTLPSVSTVELEATETAREYERREERTISDGATATDEAPDEAKLAEAETARRAEADRRAEAEEAARVARQVQEESQEELREARAAADAARAQAEAEAARRTEAEEAARRAEAEQAARRTEAEEATRHAEAEEAARRTEAEEATRRAEAEEATRRAEAEEAARIARQAQEELREARAAADAARALAEAETTRRQETERRLEEQQQAAADAARSRALAETRSSAANEQTLTDDALDDGDEPAAHGTIFAHAPATETEEDTETVEIPAHLRRADGSGDPTGDLPKAPDLDEFDIAYEVARLLENRRWDKREEPFQGFDSPPGKF